MVDPVDACEAQALALVESWRPQVSGSSPSLRPVAESGWHGAHTPWHKGGMNAHPRPRLLAALAAALLAGLTALTGCGDRSSSGASGDFLALTYNVAGLPEGISGSHPERFMPLIAPLLNAYDLVLLQETWQTPDPNPFAPTRVYHEILVAGSTHPYKSVPAEHPFNTDPRRPEALLGDGLNRFSIFPFTPVVRRAWEGCDNSAADCLALKGFSFARTTIADGVEIDVYNLHMEAGGTPNDEMLRDRGITQLLAFLAETSAGRAVIIGGDFNLHTDEEPDGSQYARLLVEGGLTDACAALACPDPGRIDKLAFRSGGGVELEATSYRIPTDVFVSPEGEALSDHDPVEVRFAWRAS